MECLVSLVGVQRELVGAYDEIGKLPFDLSSTLRVDAAGKALLAIDGLFHLLVQTTGGIGLISEGGMSLFVVGKVSLQMGLDLQRPPGWRPGRRCPHLRGALIRPLGKRTGNSRPLQSDLPRGALKRPRFGAPRSALRRGSPQPWGV